MLKLYIYGDLNSVCSSRRLEREAGRNVELMWLTGRLAPDHKTIANFRQDYGVSIQKVCAEFVGLCRGLGLFAGGTVAIDGSKFKAVNSRDNNFTQTKITKRIEQADANIVRYLTEIERADREEDKERQDLLQAKTNRLREKISLMRQRIRGLRSMQEQVVVSPTNQISKIDPDAIAMATAGKGTDIVGYNVQIAVDADHHLIMAHEVSSTGTDRSFLSFMGRNALEASGQDQIDLVADRGYYRREEILACAGTGVKPHIPRTETSGGFKRGKFTSHDYRYKAAHDHYVCPAGKNLTQSSTRSRQGRDIETIHYRNLTACKDCKLKPRCTTEPYKRVKRWKHAKVLDEMQARLDDMPDATKIRRRTVEHPFGTIKAWMGQTHFLTRRRNNVSTEMSLHVLAYNMKRMMAIFGVQTLIREIRA